MDTQQQRLAEIEQQLRRLKRARATHWLWLLALFSVGVGLGFAIAEALIDPVTVITGCGGIQV